MNNTMINNAIRRLDDYMDFCKNHHGISFDAVLSYTISGSIFTINILDGNRSSPICNLASAIDKEISKAHDTPYICKHNKKYLRKTDGVQFYDCTCNQREITVPPAKWNYGFNYQFFKFDVKNKSSVDELNKFLDNLECGRVYHDKVEIPLPQMKNEESKGIIISEYATSNPEDWSKHE